MRTLLKTSSGLLDLQRQLRIVPKPLKKSIKSAEALADLTLPQLTDLRFDSIQKGLEYYTLAVECLQPLIKHQQNILFSHGR